MEKSRELRATVNYVARPTKLDAVELDREILNVVKNQFLVITKFLKVGSLARWDPEIEAFLELVVWKISVANTNSSVGMQLLGLTFQKPTNHRKLVLYALLTVGSHYLKRRQLFTKSFSDELKAFADRILTWFEEVIHIARVVNLLVFLQKGIYPTLTHRLLGLQMESNGVGRRIGYQCLGRELLWNSFNELIFFLMPLINLKVISKYVKRLRNNDSYKSKEQVCPKISTQSQCAVCNESPIWPHCMGCPHVFCYYCLQANCLMDPKFECPTCGFCITDLQNIVRVPI